MPSKLMLKVLYLPSHVELIRSHGCFRLHVAAHHAGVAIPIDLWI